MKQCRVCGYTTKKDVCPYCNCNVMIEKNNYNWKRSSMAINWEQVKS